MRRVENKKRKKKYENIRKENNKIGKGNRNGEGRISDAKIKRRRTITKAIKRTENEKDKKIRIYKEKSKGRKK